MQFGGFELHSLSDGFFGLDGGAMFGVVPRPLWERTNPPDERNRIRLALRPLLIVHGDERILVDTGIGDRWDERSRDRYRIEQPPTVESSLARAGLRAADVTRVILTHLHFDHAGATTKLDETGKPIPRFPKARHYVQRKEWEAALNPSRRSLVSYRPDDFIPVEAAGLLDIVEGSIELLPGLELVLTGGHTPGHQIVLVRTGSRGHGFRGSGSDHQHCPTGATEANPGTLEPWNPVIVRTAVFWGDLIPTGSHIATPYIMGYDLHPLETMEQKERLVRSAIADRWLSFFEHDPDHACGIICEEGERQFLKPLAP